MLIVLDLLFSLDRGLAVLLLQQKTHKMFKFGPNVAIIANKLIIRLTSYTVTVIALGTVPGIKNAAKSATNKSEVTAIVAPTIERTNVEEMESEFCFLTDPSLLRVQHLLSPLSLLSFSLIENLFGVVFADPELNDCLLIFLVSHIGYINKQRNVVCDTTKKPPRIKFALTFQPITPSI